MQRDFAARPGGYADWQIAWHEALYGPHGCYRDPAGPARHFRTSTHAGDLLAEALLTLARQCGLARIVDVGAGRGELLTSFWHKASGSEGGAPALIGSDVVERPAGLPPGISWVRSPGGAAVADELAELLPGSLVLAHELLDDVPCPVVERDHRGAWRRLEVDIRGDERVGAAPDEAGAAWLRQWWPAQEGGVRAEIGLPRDELWAALVRSSPDCVLVAVDYEHRRRDRPPAGSLMGYRSGRACRPVPDGSCDITAHVALDAVASAGRQAGAALSQLVSQRQALLGLGVRSVLPGAGQAGADPASYLRAVRRAGEAAELLDPGGLGGFGWLLQSTGPQVPDLAGAADRSHGADQGIGQPE